MFTVKTYQISKKKELLAICATPTRQKLLQALPQDQLGITFFFVKTKKPSSKPPFNVFIGLYVVHGAHRRMFKESSKIV